MGKGTDKLPLQIKVISQNNFLESILKYKTLNLGDLYYVTNPTLISKIKKNSNTTIITRVGGERLIRRSIADSVKQFLGFHHFPWHLLAAEVICIIFRHQKRHLTG